MFVGQPSPRDTTTRSRTTSIWKRGMENVHVQTFPRSPSVSPRATSVLHRRRRRRRRRRRWIDEGKEERGRGGRRRKKDGEREREKGGGRRKESIRSRDRFVSNYSRWSRYARCLATSRGDAAGVRTPRSVAAPRAAGRGLPDHARATITDVMCRFSLLSVLFSLTGTDNSPSLSLSVGLLFFTLGPISRMKKGKIERDEM